jgi:hypothetical protein
MSKTPPIPPQQRSFHGPRANPALREGEEHAHGDSGDNPRERGRSGNLAQNVKSVQRKVQDR